MGDGMPAERVATPIDGPLNLRRTLFPLHGRFLGDGWWLCARTPDGAGSLRVRRVAGKVQGDAWGPGAAWLAGRIGSIAGLRDQPSSFVTDHPVVGELHRSRQGDRFGRTDLVFDALVSTICAQKVTGREAARAMSGLRHAFSDRAPGPHESLRLPPDPEKMAAASYYLYHRLHLEKRRADLLRSVARRAREIDSLAETDPADAALTLEAIPGVGRWTSASTLAVSHGDPDQVPVGDFHVKHIVVHHLTGNDRGTDEEMLELLEPFRPHRGRVVRLLHTLGHEPKFGPRMPARDITRM